MQNGTTDNVSMMSYGFDPYLSSWSPYQGAAYAVVESVAKIVAAGGDYSKDQIYVSGIFQKNVRRSKTLEASLCSASWSLCGTDRIRTSVDRRERQYVGTFQDIDVPPTLVSFAVDMAVKEIHYAGIERGRK